MKLNIIPHTEPSPVIKKLIEIEPGEVFVFVGFEDNKSLSRSSDICLMLKPGYGEDARIYTVLESSKKHAYAGPFYWSIKNAGDRNPDGLYEVIGTWENGKIRYWEAPKPLMTFQCYPPGTVVQLSKNTNTYWFAEPNGNLVVYDKAKESIIHIVGTSDHGYKSLRESQVANIIGTLG